MSLQKLTDREAVLSALREYDKIGQEKFLKNYHSRKAKSYLLEESGKRYEAKAIAGAAYRYQHGTPLGPQEFSGGEDTAKILRALGFKVIKLPNKFGVRETD